MQKLDHFGAKMLEKLAHLIFISPKMFFFLNFLDYKPFGGIEVFWNFIYLFYLFVMLTSMLTGVLSVIKASVLCWM